MVTLLDKLELRTMAPDPEPDPDTEIRVFHDGRREFQVIRFADWPQFRDAGYRQLAAHERESDLPRARPEKPGLSLWRGNGGTARGLWAGQRAEARKAFHRAVTALAPRVQAEPLQWEAYAGKDKADVLDAYYAAVLAEVVESLAADVDELRAQAAQKAGR